MYKRVVLPSLIVIILGISCKQDNFPVLKGPYLGQKPPGNKVEIFAPGIVCTPESADYGGHFSPDGRMFFFTRVEENNPGRLFFMEYKNNRWTKPEIVPFGHEVGDFESCFSPDGKKLVFVSSRSRPGETGDKEDFWIVELIGGKWGKPYLLAENTDFGERRISPSLAKNGTLYFSGDYNKPGDKDIYRSKLVNGKYSEPENLGPAVNTKYYEEHVYAAPDESFILFDSYRPGIHGKSDIYISFLKSDGTWSQAKNLGGAVNSEHYDWLPNVTPDGEYILFARTISGKIDIYWVSAKIIKDLKPEELK
ncbi:TolB family protein [candidate division KSB1 bacterium]